MIKAKEKNLASMSTEITILANNCADKTLRRCLGMDKLPDAPTGLQGATGIGDDRSINNLRVVTMDNEVTVLESRCIENLGYNSPNSDLFWSCVKNEIKL